tara:strand:- start:203 stop:331 length:129 start_codon:yes stop_codon:yes gene_type:complete
MELIIATIVVTSLLLSVAIFGLGFSTHKWCVENGPLSDDWRD